MTSESPRTTEASLIPPERLCFSITSNCKLKKILSKIWTVIRRNRSTTSQILTIRWILVGVGAKNPRGNTLICRFLQGIWFHTLRENGANTSSLWSPQRNCHSHKRKSSFTHRKETQTSLTSFAAVQMSVLVLANQQELAYNSSGRTQVVVWESYRKRWITETDGERKCQRNSC